MTLDERGRRAGVDLLERAQRRAIPMIELVAAPPPMHSRRVPVRALAFAALAIVAGLAFVVTRDETEPARVVDQPVPEGIQPKTFAPEGLGTSVQVPSTWIERPSGGGWQFIVYDASTDDAVVATRMTSPDDISAATFGARRRRSLGQMVGEFRATFSEEVTVDGTDAFLMQYRFDNDELRGRVFTEYDVRVGPRQFAVISISARELDGVDLRGWIGSTIAIEPTTVQDLERAIDVADGALPVPDGVESTTTFAPDGVGASVEVPAVWERGFPIDDLDVMRHSDTGVFVHVGRRSTVPTGNHVLASRDTTVAGRPAVVTRYLAGSFTPGIGALITQTSIDMGDGTFVVVQLGETNGPQDDLLDWIRSTIELTD